MHQKSVRKDFTAKVIKSNRKLGVVYGWLTVCETRKEKEFHPFVDSQNEYIPSHVMEESLIDFMEGDRIVKERHKGDSVGKVVCAFPITEETCKAFGFESDQYGSIIGVKPDKEEVFNKFEDGTYNDFSIGANVSFYRNGDGIDE